MSPVGQIERTTQNRVIKLFQDELGYSYLGNWEERANNSNIEEKLLTQYLKNSYSDDLTKRAIYKLLSIATNYNQSLYATNEQVYSLLRYGVTVQPEAGQDTETVHLIDWKNPANNDFAVAEEVTIQGNKEKRPDIVLYVNGIALGVIELKRSTISIGDGIRQSIVNQQKEFIQSFFTTIQLIFAGNDSEGLQYGTIDTPEKYYLKWKEDIEDNSRLKLDKYLIKMCNKARFLEIIHDFVLFDGGIKKLPRAHQYFGVKAAQERFKKCEGGIIWHTQGSGKSIIMVVLAKWLLENNHNARVAIITDRDELDKQIERVFTGVGEEIYRTTSGKDLMAKLGEAKPRLLCSLVHKFRHGGEADFSKFIEELKSSPSQTQGELFVFIDECHRTQSGKMHRVMKAMMPSGVFVGFTGTPLLKKDRQTTLEVFGNYIHTYKFNEGVEDEVILDLVYEARDVNQRISSPDRIDEWFDARTRGLNDYQRTMLKRKWATMQVVLSSKSRMEKIVNDIVFDFSTKPRLNSKRGNAILVASSIYEACRYFELFQKTELKEKCAVVTSYNPVMRDITAEDTGANTDTAREEIYRLYQTILRDVQLQPNKSKSEVYEEWAKDMFVKEPSNMRLLVVVDKLLTGFDAPPCTYLYIDKSMQDHGLFQAICRVNRLDGEDKDFGYIVDYENLFHHVEKAVAVYTAELDHADFKEEDCTILLKERLEKGRGRLDEAIETIDSLCEAVKPPNDTLAHIRYFCGNTEVPQEIKDTEPQRTALYKATVVLIRSYANIADDLESAGYNTDEIQSLKTKLNHYTTLREEIKRASGETLDLKTYEADMRHLIDNYIEADEARTISPFGKMTLVDIIVKSGIADAINSLPAGIQASKEAVAETIENNVRQKITREHLIDPVFFAEMSILLDTIIQERKSQKIDYEEHLKRIARLAEHVGSGKSGDVPSSIQTRAQQALYNNLEKDEALALIVDARIKAIKPDSWRGNVPREMVIKRGLYEILNDESEVERLFAIVKAQSEY